MARQPRELSPLEWHALSIAAKKRAEQLRDELVPGTGQAVDVTVRVKGAVDVGSEQQGTQKKKPTAELVLGMVLCDLGPRQVRDVLKKLEPRMQALSRGEVPPGLDEQTMEAIERLLGLGEQFIPQPKRGNVTGSLAVERA